MTRLGMSIPTLPGPRGRRPGRRPGRHPSGGSIEKIKKRIREIIQFPKIRAPRRRKRIR